jgi:hypothetical protein
MILKVQLPLESNHPNPPALIYPQGKVWLLQSSPEDLPYPVTQAVKAGGGKAYFHAQVVHGEDKTKKIAWGVQAEPQEW